MKKVLALVGVVFITIFWMACNKDVPNVITPDSGECLTTVIDKQAFDNAGNDPFTLVNVFIIDDCLLLNVNYAGGCGVSEFQLFSTGEIMETEPPSLALKLGFNSNDPCEALITESMQFDLNAIQSLAEGEINLLLEGHDDRLRYSY